MAMATDELLQMSLAELTDVLPEELKKPSLDSRPPAEELLQMLPEEARAEFLLLPPDLQEQMLNVMTAVGASGAAAAMQFSVRSSEEDVKEASAAPQNAEHRDLWHGLLGRGNSWSPPKTAVKSNLEARPGYEAYDASEYLDTPEVLKQKVKLLAQMWKRSGNDTVIYTGAGLSTASGIGDYASKAADSIAPHKGKVSTGSRLDLKPTLAHHVLASMGDKGLIGNWVQQNHDRLAQKAGFPQAKINEIHGAWGDSKNQVKMMDDTLRRDLLTWLVAWAERAKMCVALGTSLCGMNADQVPQGAARRFIEEKTGEGLVIIGLQKSVYDEAASLKIWGLCDDVMRLLAAELGVKAPNAKVARRGEDWVQKHPRLVYNTPTRSAKDPM